MDCMIMHFLSDIFELILILLSPSEKIRRSTGMATQFKLTAILFPKFVEEGPGRTTTSFKMFLK